MLKIHSFLQRIKKPVQKLPANRMGRYKMHIAVFGYMLITVLFILSPDYFNGVSTNSMLKHVKSENKYLASEIGEETAKEAIVQNNLNILVNKFILCDLTKDRKLIELTNVKERQADSPMLGAVAEEKVDSGSTNEEINRQTYEAVAANEIQNEKSNERNVKVKKKGTADTDKTVAASEKKVKGDKKHKAAKEVKSDTKKKEEVKIHLAESEVNVLQRIVEAEATGENIKGKMLVANVILNRVNSNKFPDSVKEVVFQRNGGTYQFSPIKDKRYWSVNITKETVKAVERVMNGEDYSNGALYFSARSKADPSSMRWFDRHLKFLFEYGGHEFFK